jgi:hypothetical protein
MKFPALTSLLLLTLVSFAQKRTLLGNFVFDEQVYQYEYKKDGTIHSLKLSSLSGEEWPGDLKAEQLTSTIALLDSATITDSIGAAIYDSVKWLPALLGQFQKVASSKPSWKDDAGKLEDYLRTLETPGLDTLRKFLTAKGGADPASILKMYRGFLNMVQEPRQTKAVPFADLKEEVFLAVFQKELSQLYALDGKTISSNKQVELNRKANEIMYEIRARAEFEDDEPVTAYMKLKRKLLAIEVPIAVTGGQTPTYKNITVQFQLSNIQIEFEDGGIKHILADLVPQLSAYSDQYGSNTIRFRNLAPISISGKFDPDFFSFQRIYAGNSRELMSILREEAYRQLGTNSVPMSNFKENNPGIYFPLSTLLDYLIIAQSENEDYSPANSIVELNENRTVVQLKKEKRSKIITARMFSDLAGVSSDNPNGLVQIEIGRRINLVTDRSYIRNERKFTKPGKMIAYGGFITFIEPRFTFSKIEDNNKFYIIDSNSMNRDKSFVDSQNHFRLNPIEVLRHQQLSIGLLLNFYKWNLINKKTNFQLNWYFGYGRTPMADSFLVTNKTITLVQQRNETYVSTIQYGPTVLVEFKPDARWGVSIGADLRWIKVKHPQFEIDPRFKDMFFTTWFDGHIKTNNSSKIFFRFRKNWIHQQSDYNFNQMQFGYEFDIFKAK